MKAWAATICLVAFCSCPALAQDPVSDSDPKVQLAAKVLEESRAADRVKAGWDTLIPQMVAGIKQQAPNLTDAQLKRVSDLLLDELKGMLPALLSANARIYANHFTLEELGALDRFYASSVGQKLAAETPAIVKEDTEFAITFGDKIAAIVVPRVIEKLRKEGIKI